MDEIRDVKYKLINTNNKIIELTKIVDPTSAVAKREETHILSKTKILHVYILVHTNCSSYIRYDSKYD